jgi:uncharacterized protein YegJ (DUF2314 family)
LRAIGGSSLKPPAHPAPTPARRADARAGVREGDAKADFGPSLPRFNRPSNPGRALEISRRCFDRPLFDDPTFITELCTMRIAGSMAWTAGLGALLAMSACGDAGRSSAQDPPARTVDAAKNIVNVSNEDAEMNAAIDRARATVHDFLPHLQNPPKGQEYLGVKVRLGDDPQRGEHIWLYDVRYDGGRIAGKLMDDADYFPQWKQGATVRVAPEEITDWMTVENGHVCGGFTSRVVVSTLPPEQQREWFTAMDIGGLPAGTAVCDEGGSL